MTNDEAAIDEISSEFYQAWKAAATAIVGYVPDVFWPGVIEPDEPDRSKYWARFSTQIVDQPQKTLRNGTSRTFKTYGIVFVQIFSPRSDSLSMQRTRKLAILSRNAFRKRSSVGNIVFRNSRVNEIPPETSFNRLNVVAEFEYDENYEG